MQDAVNSILDDFRPYSVYTSGVLFGVGWWVWGDSIVVSVANGASSFSPLFLIPGLVATLAILIMNCTPRSELNNSVYGDDASVCRARLSLFVSYVFAVAAISSAVGLLIHAQNQASKTEGEEPDLWIGAAGIIQSCLVVGSGLIAWYCREGGDDSDYGYY